MTKRVRNEVALASGFSIPVVAQHRLIFCGIEECAEVLRPYLRANEWIYKGGSHVAVVGPGGARLAFIRAGQRF